MKGRVYSFLLLSFLFLNFFSVVGQQEVQPLPIDPKLKYGTLPNGLTYYIRHNAQTKDRADFYIVQNVGSILEEESQRGLAHFLEHMAFNGTKNFPGDGISDFTESIGIRMGENLNAYTGFDETVYMIMNAPVADESVIDSCLLILHDWSGFILLVDSAIEKERDIIREEWRTRQDAQARLWEQQLPKLYPDSRYADRMPIGTIDVINNFQPDELRNYYKKWYRPDLQAIIVVGDIDADKVETTVKEMFSDISVPVNPAERIWYEVPDNNEPLISIATDKEATNIILYLLYKHDKLPHEFRNTTGGMLMDYFQSMTATMLNERFSELLQKSDPPFIYATSFDDDYMVSKTKGAWTVAALVQEGEIDRALDALVMEIERAKQFGFTESEYERARINFLKEYETAYNERENQRNSSYTREYVDHFTNGGYIPGIEMEYELINQIASSIPVEQVNEFFRTLIKEDNMAISLTGPEKEEVSFPSEMDLLALYRNAQNIPVEAYEEEIIDEPLMSNLPEPGKIIETFEDPKFGATVLTLNNGVKVVLKHTDFKKDQIIMTATSPGGSTLFGDKDIYNLKIFNDVITLGGIGKFSSVELKKVLAGKRVNCAPSLGLDSENFNGSAAPADLETLFQMIYLMFTAPRMDEEAYQSFESRMKSQLQNMDLNPMVAFSDTLSRMIYGDNPRAMRLQYEDFDKINYSRIMEMYKERYSDASDFVFTFVGNLDKETILPYIEQYLASLSSLERRERGDERKVPSIQNGNRVNHFSRSMETPKSSVFNFYSGNMPYSLENIIKGNMLKQILDLIFMEKIREQEGATYGVQTSLAISYFPEGQSYLQTYFDTDPEKKAKMSELIKEEIKQMASYGPDQLNFDKTKENLLKRHAENLQENSYWLGVLDNYYYKNFDTNTQYKALVENMTPKDIQEFLKQLLEQNNSIEVIMDAN